MVQAGEIFEIALSLMDEAGDSDERERYEERAPELLRAMVGEKRLVDGKRGWFMPIDDLEDPVEGVEESYALGVMPYGLAALLLAEVQPELADFFESRYESLRAEYERRRICEAEEILNLYGGLEHGAFGSW